MKRRIVSSIVSALSLMFVAVPAYAADASISNTGPGSTNFVTDTSNSSYSCSSNNVAEVTNDNNQNGRQEGSNTGNATTSSNTTAGSATSGSSSNSNSSSTAIAQNGCASSSTQTANNPSGGKGADVPAATQTVTLPDTGAVSPAEATARITALLSGLGIAAYFGRALVLRKQN